MLHLQINAGDCQIFADIFGVPNFATSKIVQTDFEKSVKIQNHGNLGFSLLFSNAM